MNKTKIEYADYTWNPITGCRHNCWYCYARRLAEGRLKRFYPNGFVPTFHPGRLPDPHTVKDPARILACSMGDMMGAWVESRHIWQILAEVTVASHHTFLLLTKNPQRYQDFDLPVNAWAGATIDGQDAAGLLLHDLERAQAKRWVSFEPLLGPVHPEADFFFLRWVVIGALTGPRAEDRAPRREWIAEILEKADYYSIPVFMKDNLRPYWDGEWRQQLPSTEE